MADDEAPEAPHEEPASVEEPAEAVIHMTREELRGFAHDCVAECLAEMERETEHAVEETVEPEVEEHHDEPAPESEEPVDVPPRPMHPWFRKHARH